MNCLPSHHPPCASCCKLLFRAWERKSCPCSVRLAEHPSFLWNGDGPVICWCIASKKFLWKFIHSGFIRYEVWNSLQVALPSCACASPPQDVTITNDGATILKLLEVEHPAGKILCELADLQDQEVGDGTTSVVRRLWLWFWSWESSAVHVIHSPLVCVLAVFSCFYNSSHEQKQTNTVYTWIFNRCWFSFLYWPVFH